MLPDKCHSSLRLLHSLNLVFVGLSVGYETCPVIGSLGLAGHQPIPGNQSQDMSHNPPMPMVSSLVWLAVRNINQGKSHLLWILVKLQCIVDWCAWREFPPFFSQHWQSLAQPLWQTNTQNYRLSLLLCNETVNVSTLTQSCWPSPHTRWAVGDGIWDPISQMVYELQILSKILVAHSLKVLIQNVAHAMVWMGWWSWLTFTKLWPDWIIRT